MLGKKPEDIRLGDVIRISEADFALVECLAPTTNVSSQSVVGFPMS